MTKDVRDKSEHMSSSLTQKTKQQLFANLLKVQYPMAQEAPSPEPGPQKASNQGYLAHMDSLIKQYEDEL